MNKTKTGLLEKFEQRKEQVKIDELKAQHSQLTEQETHSTDAINKLTDADMPALDTLDEESDYSMFMSDKVSDVLRKKALRKLFLSPHINVLDALNDYDEDYTSFELLGDIIPYDLKQEIKRKAKEQQELATTQNLTEQEISKDQQDTQEKQQNSEVTDDN